MPRSTRSFLQNRSRRGAILVGVLWVTMLLSALAVVLRVHMSSVAQSVHMMEGKAVASVLADAGLAVAAARIRGAPAQGPAAIGDTVQERIELPAGNIDAFVRNEALRVDINKAEPALVEGVLIAAGATPMLAGRLARILTDMREAPGVSPLGPLQSIDELAFIPDMPAAVALRAGRFATVSSGLSGARLDAVDEALLRAIPGLPRQLRDAIAGWRAGRVTRQQLDQLLAESELHTAERSAVWRATLTVTLASGHMEAQEVLMLVAEGDDVAYRVLDWRRPTDEVD